MFKVARWKCLTHFV